MQLQYKVQLVRNGKMVREVMWSQNTLELINPDEAQALEDPMCKGTVTKGKFGNIVIEKYW